MSVAGLLAHLVERFHGMEEVRGSIPLESTSIKKHPARVHILFVDFRVNLLGAGLRGNRKPFELDSTKGRI
jgi:hypothetical protein